MRLSVSAARNGELVNIIVLTTAASVTGNMDFILILSVVVILFLYLLHVTGGASSSLWGVTLTAGSGFQLRGLLREN
jgi:hypothetical protein